MTEANNEQSQPVAQPVTTDASQAQDTVEAVPAPAVSPSDVNKNSAPAMGVSQVPDESGDAERQQELENQQNDEQQGGEG